MSPKLFEISSKIQSKIDEINTREPSNSRPADGSDSIEQIVKSFTAELSAPDQARISNEFFSFGPLEDLLLDEEITEILVNSSKDIHFEKKGRIEKLNDGFFSKITYRNCVHRILEETQSILSLEKPFCDIKYKDFRISLVDESVTQSETLITFRRHPKRKWTIDLLEQNRWCSSAERRLLEMIVQTKKNFLVVGTTGAGKTSVINALLDITEQNERSLIIEDTEEIQLPNPLSFRLLTREETQHGLSAIDQSQLVKRALRLRPDRIVMGEIRHHEAKDFLMALSTGHKGSFGTLHAQDAHQALLRLEMLIQMGAPHWKLSAIRRLISLSLELVIVAERTPLGERKLEGIYTINSLEENGFLIEKLGTDRIPLSFIGA